MFELGTKKHGGRTFLFAAESAEERNAWMVKLAKVNPRCPSRLISCIITLTLTFREFSADLILRI